MAEDGSHPFTAPAAESDGGMPVHSKESDPRVALARSCATWVLVVSLAWGLFTFFVQGIGGVALFGRFPKHAWDIVVVLLVIPWLPATIPRVAVSQAMVPFWSRRVSPLAIPVWIVAGYLSLSLVWIYFHLVGLWTLDTAIFVSLFNYLPCVLTALVFLLRVPGATTAKRPNALAAVQEDGSPFGLAETAMSEKGGERPPTPEKVHREVDSQRIPTPEVIGQGTPEGKPTLAGQAAIGQAYRTTSAILLFDHNVQLDSYSARSLVATQTRLVVVRSGTQYIKVRTEDGVEGFVVANEQLTPILEPLDRFEPMAAPPESTVKEPLSPADLARTQLANVPRTLPVGTEKPKRGKRFAIHSGVIGALLGALIATWAVMQQIQPYTSSSPKWQVALYAAVVTLVSFVLLLVGNNLRSIRRLRWKEEQQGRQTDDQLRVRDPECVRLSAQEEEYTRISMEQVNKVPRLLRLPYFLVLYFVRPR